MVKGVSLQSRATARSGKCLAILLVCLGLLLATGWWLWFYVSSGEAGADAVELVFDGLLDEVAVDIPGEERAEARAVVAEFTADLRAGNVTLEQGVGVTLALAEDFLPVILARAFEARYVESAPVPDEEKREARLTLSRFTRGILAEQIPPETTERVVNSFTEEDANGEVMLAERLTVEELRAILAEMKTAADTAGVSQDYLEQDLATALRAAIARGMSGEVYEERGTEPAPAEAPPTPAKENPAPVY